MKNWQIHKHFENANKRFDKRWSRITKMFLSDIQNGKIENENKKIYFIQLCNRNLSKLDTAHLELVELYNFNFPELANGTYKSTKGTNTISMCLYGSNTNLCSKPYFDQHQQH